MPTIGVALAIPEPWGSTLQAHRLAAGDETAVHIPSHVTLVPPLEVAEEDLPAIHEHLAQVARAVPRFRIRLRGTGTFRPVSPVVFVMVAEGISACEVLAAALRTGPLAVTLQFPYHPHVTVAHRLPDEALDRVFAELADFECVFSAGAFHLYEHREESGWRPTREYSLALAPVPS